MYISVNFALPVARTHTSPGGREASRQKIGDDDADVLTMTSMGKFTAALATRNTGRATKPALGCI